MMDCDCNELGLCDIHLKERMFIKYCKRLGVSPKLYGIRENTKNE